ncbi:hypothetical protein BJ742DRAFT_835076 [Cladochytrium replicatum]|nr:hypothetical protein BJ742DRAFT_835076 [Cladochytrium replicatum]
MSGPFTRRDLAGYGPVTPDPKWPNNAKIAINFVLNYEEGGENTPANNDSHSEVFLNETPGGNPRNGRDMNMETQFEYGSRAGFWRILRLFDELGMKLTSYAVGRAVEHNPVVVRVLEEQGHEVASHNYRWIDYNSLDEEAERQHIQACIRAIQRASPTGRAPVGWYTGRISPRSRTLVLEEYAKLNLPLLYDSDSYNDDLPYYLDTFPTGHLVIPYTLDQNDMKFSVAPGFGHPEAFFVYLKNTFDTLYAEGVGGAPKMMSVGLHCRIIGKPGRIPELRKFMEYVKGFPDVWVTTREEIAMHWRKTFPYEGITRASLNKYHV